MPGITDILLLERTPETGGLFLSCCIVPVVPHLVHL